MEVQKAINEALIWAQSRLAQAAQPWFYYQGAIIAVLFVAAKLATTRIEPVLEGRARAIKGHPGLLRLVIALMRRTQWILFVILLLAGLVVLRSVTWPSYSYLVSIAFYLSFAWLFVSVLSRIVRNRLVARTLGWLAWVYAALVILGIDDDAAAFLDGLALPFGELRLSALTILKAVLLLTATLWLAVIVGNYFEERVQRSDELTPSIRVLIGKVAKIGLILVAGAIALSSVGVDLTAFTIFSGAIGVCLGSGCRRLFRTLSPASSFYWINR